MKITYSVSAKEERMLQKGDIQQWWKDTREFHVRADDPIAAAGSVVMAPAATVAKLPNAVFSAFSSVEAKPLGESPVKYSWQGVQLTVDNTASLLKNLLTLHPIKAAGNAVGVATQIPDLLIVNPALDLTSDVVGHVNRRRQSIGQQIGNTFSLSA